MTRTPTDAAQRAVLLAQQVRGSVVESEHRGHVAVARVDGLPTASAGDAGHVVMLRSVAKPFALVALLTAPGVDGLRLTDGELAVMAGSHSGEDVHVVVLRALHARAGLDAAVLVCGPDHGLPLDARTAARLTQAGEVPGRLRHQCSGQHTALLLLARLGGWDPAAYWLPEHPVQRAVTEAIAAVAGTPADGLPVAIDGCGTPTHGLPMHAVARLHARLADPHASSLPAPVARALARVRDAMLAAPELLGGAGDRLDTVLMQRLPGRLTVKVGAEGLAGIAVLPAAGPRTATSDALGIAIKIDDGDPTGRALSASVVETLRSLGLLDAAACTDLARFHTPVAADSLGREAARTIPQAVALSP